MYRRGHLKVDLDFEYASDFIGLAADARTGRYLPSVFLLLAGSSRPWDSLRWIPGTTGINANQMGALPASAILPDRARLEIHTGGGVSFGYEKQTFLVK